MVENDGSEVLPEHQDRERLAAEERLRIAREMYDGMAQVLAYVNLKAQAVKEHLRAGRTDDAIRHLDQLASAAREVYDEARESIAGLQNAAVLAGGREEDRGHEAG